MSDSIQTDKTYYVSQTQTKIEWYDNPERKGKPIYSRTLVPVNFEVFSEFKIMDGKQ